MFELEQYSKKELRRGKWVTLFALLLGSGALVGIQADAAGVMGLGALIAMLVRPKTTLRWLVPITLIISAWSFVGVSIFVKLLLTVAVIAVRMILLDRLPQSATLPNATKNKIDTSQLNKRDITVFKSVFKRTEVSINHVEQLLQATKGLRKIAEEGEPVRFSRAILKELATDPTQLTDADEFVYTHLPNMEKLLVTYHEIIKHEVITDADKKQLAEAREVLRLLANSIQTDYHKITRDDIASLQDQMDMVKRTMGDKES